jgi:hypothetical protein
MEKSTLRLLTSGSDSGLGDNVRERLEIVSGTAKFSACKSIFLIATLSIVNGSFPIIVTAKLEHSKFH